MVASNESKARKPRGFAALAPSVKLAIWLVAVATLAAGVQGIAWVLGLDFDIFLESGGGRGVLLGLALASLLLLMAIDGRPAADYGLAVGGRWKKLLLGGCLTGAVSYLAYYALVVLPWAGRLDTGSLTLAGCLAAGCAALATAFPVAITQQIIFAGYLLSILRERHSRVTAVVVPAALFALLRRMDNPALILTPEGYPLVVGLFLIASLLGVLRLKTGSILLPAGVLAGCIFMRRFLRKTAVVAITGSPNAVAWTAPGGEPVQAPALWALLIAAIALCWWLMRERTFAEETARNGFDTGFKRTFPLSNTSMLAPLDVWLMRLADARFRVGLKYVPRLIAILVFSGVNTILSLPERLLAPLLLRRQRVADPVFIVGVHRSGTTHLHNMLALDPQFSTPRAYQILNPAGFFSLSWLVAPLLGTFLPWKRPMDAVRFHIFAPQEGEYVMAGVSRLSPYWGMTFPRRGAAYDRYIFPEQLSPSEKRAWQGHLILFLRKLTFWSRRRPLLKNPYNTARVAALSEIFPRARFIHIHRHPYDVYRSNMHTAREGHIVNQLQDPDEADSYQTRFLDNYRAMEEAFYRASRELSPENVVEVRFEDVERDPLGEVRRIYAQLGLVFSARFQERLQRYLESVAGYQKNRFGSLPEDVQARIDAQMGLFMERWGYSPAAAPSRQPERRQAA